MGGREPAVAAKAGVQECSVFGCEVAYGLLGCDSTLRWKSHLGSGHGLLDGRHDVKLEK